MNTRQENKSVMYVTIETFLLQYEAITNKLPNFLALFTLLQSIIKQITSAGEQQKFNRKGIAKTKDQWRHTLETLVGDTARKLKAYASFTNNLTLLNEVDFSESYLKNISGTKLLEDAQGIFYRANDYLSELDSYVITEESQAKLQEAIQGYRESLPKPRLGATEKKQYTEKLIELFGNGDDTLDKIDGAVDVVRLTEPDFYIGYKTARKIISTGGRKVSLKTMVNDTYGNPVKGAIVKLVMNGNSSQMKAATVTNEIVKKTARKGGFRLQGLASGTYQVIISKPGFKDQVATVVIADGEIFVLKVILEKA